MQRSPLPLGGCSSRLLFLAITLQNCFDKAVNVLLKKFFFTYKKYL